MQLSLDEFTSLMATLGPVEAHVAIAVSGGADSLALCVLSAQWAALSGRRVTALSVDHGLRPQSQDECRWVKEQLSQRGIEHHTLVWQGEKPENGLQAAARTARYGLLESWCRAHGLSDLLLAHHLDDQAETFLLRLARGSGVDGLGAMQAVSHQGGLRLLRPLLAVPKSDLRDYLRALGQEWIEDPSNENAAFDRVKIRQHMNILADLGLNRERLARTAQSMQRAAASLQRMTRDWLKKHVQVFDEGYALVDRNGFEDLDEEILLRALARIGTALSGRAYPPRLEKTQRLAGHLRQGRDATFCDCRWIMRETDVLVCRELRRPEIAGNLYTLDYHHSCPGVHVRMLGQDGWQAIKAQVEEKHTARLPKAVLYSLISFWDDQGVLDVPDLGFKREGTRFEVHMTFTAKKRLFS